MKNIAGPPVLGDDLYGRSYEISRLWELLDQGHHILMLAPRRTGKTSLMQELERDPQPNWDVIFVDLQAGDSADDLIAAILARLARHPRYRTWLEASGLKEAVSSLLNRLSLSIDAEVARVEIKGAIAGDWQHAAEVLARRLADPPDPDRRLLVILDELPILISRLLRNGQKAESEAILSWLREIRLTPGLRGRVGTLLGGSIGLDGVLRRARLSDTINDLADFRLQPWNRETATGFLRQLGIDSDFPFSDEQISVVLDLLGDPVPFHVQLLFSAVKDATQGDAAKITPETIEGCFNTRLAGSAGNAHLDHYWGRLEIIFSEEQLDLTRTILNRACRKDDCAIGIDFKREQAQDENLFREVLRELVADGYLELNDGVIRFRSNLLREWWRNNHAWA